MRMNKKPLNLLIDAGLVEKAREKGIVISKFLENKLQEYFQFIEMVSKPQNQCHEKGVGSLRFELKTSSVSGRRHNQLDHEPKHVVPTCLCSAPRISHTF